jgi:hypothetical protein
VRETLTSIDQQSDESSNYPMAEKIRVKMTNLGNGESVLFDGSQRIYFFRFSDVDQTSIYG